jgi:hypothetical protein
MIRAIRKYARFATELVADAVSPTSRTPEVPPNIAPDIQSCKQATKRRVTEEHGESKIMASLAKFDQKRATEFGQIESIKHSGGICALTA